jgi:uncharacterized membrane protein YkvI
MSDKLKSVNKFVLPVSVGAASTWFGAHCGSGFASGRQYVQYYSRFGATALWTPLITWGIMVVAMYLIMEYSKLEGITNYKDYAEKFYFPNTKFKYLPVLYFDFWLILAQLMGMAGVLAGGGALLESSFGMSYWLGVAITGIVILLAVVFGANGLMRFATAITVGLIITIGIIGIILAKMYWDNLTYIVGNGIMAEGATVPQAMWNAVLQAGVQIGIMGAMIGLTAEMTKEKDIKQTAVVGAILNLSMVMLFGLGILATYPMFNDSALPVLEAIKEVNYPVLLLSYQILMFGALVTTGASCAFTMISRFNKYGKDKIQDERIRNLIIVLVISAIGVFGSSFGLIAIFAQGYTMLASLSIPGVLLPALVLGPYRVKQARARAKAEGIEL